MTGNVDLDRQRVAGPTPGESPPDLPPSPVEPPAPVPAAPSAGRWLLVVGVVAGVVGLLALLGYGLARRQGGIPGVAINTTGQIGRVRPGPAPDFTLQRYEGEPFRLSEQRGRVVVVNFWASWCPPCREEAPALERAWRRYRDRGVVLVGVDIWDTERDARAFLREFGVTYPNGPDPRGAIAIDYGLTGIPETFIIRPDGTILRHWIGPLTEQQISAFIEEALR